MEKNYNNEPISMALGFFDGVHMGHQELIKVVINKAENQNIKSAVLSFKEHPLTEIFPRYKPELLSSNQEKIKKLEDLLIDFIFLEEFNEALMKLTPEEFIRDFLLKKFNIKDLVVGFNYSFGYKGEGDAELLKKLGEKYGFNVHIVDPLIMNDDLVSSTNIRSYLKDGQVEEVTTLLGHPYFISGKIKSGKKLGRQYNIPTANLEMDTKKILPKNGVYFTRIKIDGKTYDGLTNLGFNPTFKNHPYSIETYIYDFNDDIYDKEVTLEFLHKIRDEKKFASLEQLFDQIKSDIKKADLLYRK